MSAGLFAPDGSE